MDHYSITIFINLFISWSIYIYIYIYIYFAYVSHTTNILNVHIDTTCLHVYAKTQPAAIYTSHGIARYVLETNIPIKLGIYAKYW